MNLSKHISSEKHRRVLIVNGQLSQDYGTGIYLTYLFSSWPGEKVATVSRSTYPYDSKLCSSHFCVCSAARPANRLLARSLDTHGNGSSKKTIFNFFILIKPLFSKFFSKIKQILRYFFGFSKFCKRTILSDDLLAWISEFKPEIIYGGISDLSTLRFLRKIQLHTKLPLVLHIMDDWSSTLYNRGVEKYTIRPRYLHEYEHMMRQADVLIAICKSMADEFSTRYQRDVIYFPMPTSLVEYKDIHRTQWSSGKPFVIRYGGRVGWSIRDSLTDIARVINKLQNNGYRIKFEIATNQTDMIPTACSEFDCVSIVRLAPLSELPLLNSLCDIHLICYDFDDLSITQARYSMPSKLPSCMASGNPILVYGPPCLPVVEYVQRENLGSVVCTRDDKMIETEMIKLLDSCSLREFYGTKARAIAFERHDATIVSNSLSKVIASVNQVPVAFSN